MVCSIENFSKATVGFGDFDTINAKTLLGLTDLNSMISEGFSNLIDSVVYFNMWSLCADKQFHSSKFCVFLL